MKGIALDQSSLRRIISGEDRSLRASVLLRLLCLISYIYSGIIRTRNLLYDTGILDSRQIGGFVISIGNITAGGTGKTPLVIWLYKFLNKRGIKCSILTRGYKTQSDGETLDDEPQLLQENCPEAKVIVNANRLEAGIRAVRDFAAKAIILDDGFQHRRLARDIDIVCVDSSCPFGYGKVLPAGFLREPPASLKRATAIVLTRTDQADKPGLEKLTGQIKKLNPEAVIALTRHKVSRIRTNTGRQFPLNELEGKRVYAFCGIGNPQAFFHTLQRTGANLAGTKFYDDHHHYNKTDIDEIERDSRKKGAELIITTEKDYIKLVGENLKSEAGFCMLKIEMDFVSGREQLEEIIEQKLAQKNVEFGKE